MMTDSAFFSSYVFCAVYMSTADKIRKQNISYMPNLKFI